VIIFRNRRFGLLWGGQLLSNIGGWLMVVAVPVFVFNLTGSVLHTGLAFVAETLPAVIFGPFGGVYSDRWNRRTTMIYADIGRALAILPMLLVAHQGQVWIVFVAIFAENTLAQLFQPSQRALIVSVVGRGPELDSANSWSTISSGVVRLVGAPLGGALYALLSFNALVVIDSLTYVVSALALILMRGTRSDTAEPEGGEAAPAGVIAEIVEGLRFLHHHRALRGLLVVDALFLGANGGLNVLLVPFMVSHLHTGSDRIGLLMSALGVGYLLSARVGKLAARTGRFAWNMAGLLVAVAVFFATLFGIPSFAAAMVSIGLLGIPGGALLMLIQIRIQRDTPDRVLGRISSAFSTAEMTATVLGALIAGWLAGVWGMVPVIVAAIVVLALAAPCAVVIIPAGSPVSPQPDATDVSEPAGDRPTPTVSGAGAASNQSAGEKAGRAATEPYDGGRR
jgi:predicted MFS family arabinose efflux permease